MATSDNQPELLLDDKAKRQFVSWYKTLPEVPGLIRFFDRKGYCSVHGENALFIAREFCKTTAVVKYFGSPETGLASVTLGPNQFEACLRELLVQRAEHSIELYEGFGASWRLGRSASPGKLTDFEDEIFNNAEMADMPVVAAVALAMVEGQRMVGVAYVDAATRQLGVCEFHDDDQFSSLEAVIVQMGAKECVVPKEAEQGNMAADFKRVEGVLSSCNTMPSGRPKAIFSCRNLEQDLVRLVRGGNVEQHRDVLERQVACSALAAVLAFMELTADASQHGKWRLSLYDARRFMRLDAAAQRALNVFPARGDSNNSFSLYGLLNRCRTAMGKRLLKVWLKQPLISTEHICSRHDVVAAFVDDIELRDTLRDQVFRGMPDVDRLTRKLDRKRSSLADLCQLYRASSRLPAIASALRQHAGEHAQLLQQRYVKQLEHLHDDAHLTKFEELLEAAVDLDAIPEEYLISAAYNPNLQELRQQRDAEEAGIAKLASEIASDLNLVLDKTIKLEWHAANKQRLRCMRITAKEEKTVRKRLQAKYMLLETRKDGTKFTNRAMKDAAERLQDVMSKYQELQQELVQQVVGVAHTFVEVWEQVVALLSELDVLLGFADLAVSARTPYVRPEMLDAEQGQLVLEGCRHPCVEAQDGVAFIKNDCRMERGTSWFQIITGPNMGGKSTFIRQVGVNVLMAQVGCFVPCDRARIACRDSVFARVGAGDCQLRGVSTFMSEMLETASILHSASHRSLVIIDELGRGTSTYDGFGLAWAISEHLMEVVGAPTLFATHFHELTALEGPVGVANLHVETALDPATSRLTMLYKVSPGACDQSFGIHVAEFARFPQQVVDLAKAKLAELESCQPSRSLLQLLGAKRKRASAAEEEPHDPATEDDPPAASMAAESGPGREEGRSQLQTFLSAFRSLPLAELPPQEAVGKARSLLQQLQQDAASLPWLQLQLQQAAQQQHAA